MTPHWRWGANQHASPVNWTKERNKGQKAKKPRKLVSFQGFRYCESGGKEEIRTRFGSVPIRVKPAQYGLSAPFTSSIRRYSAL